MSHLRKTARHMVETSSLAAGRRPTAIAVLVLVVLAVSLWQNLAAVPDSQFHPDESRWLNRSRYLTDLQHPLSARWADRYLTRGQPPMGSYTMGLGLLLQGRDLGQNGPWDFHYGNESNISWNTVKGNTPDPADLLAARRTSAVIGALTGLVLLLIVAGLSNWIGGAIAALFLTFHPLQVYLATLAVSDAIFTFLVALSVLLVMMLVDNPTWPRATSLGIVLGLGAATKLSPLFVAFALAGLGAVLLTDGLLRRMPVAGRLWRWWSLADRPEARRLAWMLIALPGMSFAAFVASYPYLWSDPIGRTRILLDFRQHEMENQARIWPNSAIDSRLEALDRTWRTLEHSYSTTGRLFAWLGDTLDRDWSGLGVDLPIAGAGLMILVWFAIRHGFPSRQTFTLAIIAIQSGIVLAKLSVDFNRYYEPIVFVSAIGVGVLAGQLWQALVHVIRHRSSLIRRGTAVAAPPPLHSAPAAHRRSTALDG